MASLRGRFRAALLGIGLVVSVGSGVLAAARLALAREARVLEAEDGERIEYTIRTYSADAHRLPSHGSADASDALDAARRITRLLAAGELEDVSLLSNAPKARFDRLREAFGDWTKDEFERAFGRYFNAENRILGDAAIGRHRLLMWYLKDSDHVTAYYFVDVDGRLLLDDAPSETRAKLRRVLEAYRAGRAPGTSPQR